VEEVVGGARPRFLTDRGSNRRQALPLRQPIHADMAGGAELGATCSGSQIPSRALESPESEDESNLQRGEVGPGLCTFTSFGPSLMGLLSFPCIEYCSMFFFAK
jgi:hypothetical protein